MSSFNSIYVKNAGSKATAESLKEAFSSLGEIERVDVVDFIRPDGSKGKNAFIHFLEWNTDSETCDFKDALIVAQSNGEKQGLVWVSNGWRFYVLVNEAPLKLEPLNAVQLTNIVQEQRSTIDDLKMIMDIQTQRISDLEREMCEIRLILGGRSMSNERRKPSLCLEDLETDLSFACE